MPASKARGPSSSPLHPGVGTERSRACRRQPAAGHCRRRRDTRGRRRAPFACRHAPGRAVRVHRSKPRPALAVAAGHAGQDRGEPGPRPRPGGERGGSAPGCRCAPRARGHRDRRALRSSGPGRRRVAGARPNRRRPSRSRRQCLRHGGGDGTRPGICLGAACAADARLRRLRGRGDGPARLDALRAGAAVSLGDHRAHG